MYQNVVKRIFDLLIACIALILLSPIFIILAVIIRLKLGAPVFFLQERPGYQLKIFTIYKFRTMTDQMDQNGKMLDDDSRSTRLGKFLRSTSLDELPELINIIKGDMSFIGPRPLLVEHLLLYADVKEQRHSVKPGLSGLAQVNGRNSLSLDDKLSLDLQYVKNISFLLDLKLFFITIRKVFKREGIEYTPYTTKRRHQFEDRGEGR